MWTRSQYLNGECTHQDYYAQFVTERTLTVLRNSSEYLTIINDKSEHLTDLSCKVFWDRLPTAYNRAKMQEAGDYLTIAGAVCIYKAAAKMLQDEYRRTALAN